MKREPDVLGIALENLAGAAMVLDRRQRVQLASPEAVRLLGRPLQIGSLVTEALGIGKASVLARGLAGAQVVSASIPLKGALEGTALRVRAFPDRTDDPRAFLLLLDVSAASPNEGPMLFHGMWSQDVRMKELFRVIERVAADDDTVLVRGETGSGKELVAGAIHALSERRKGPMRAINCAALPSNLLESELFGHVRGSFTGAHRDTPGHILLADKGTLFLDEVAELPLDVQAKLLRVLETHTVIPIGGREPIPVDVRVVSATHRALRKEAQAGRFRADLLYRLRVIPVFIPPLRDRLDDLGLLCEKLVVEMNPGRRRKIERIAPAALDVLLRHGWPGNIRELRNVLAYAYAIGDGPVLLPSDLPPELLAPDAGLSMAPVDETDDGTPRPSAGRNDLAIVRDALRRANGNRAKAAAILGMSRVTLWRRMRELGLLRPD